MWISPVSYPHMQNKSFVEKVNPFASLAFPQFFPHGQEDLRKGIDPERKFYVWRSRPMGSLEEASSARPLRTLRTQVMALSKFLL